jgi:DNA-binding NarL/FixJ family response regulator
MAKINSSLISYILVENDETFSSSLRDILDSNNKFKCRFVFDMAEDLIKLLREDEIPDIIFLDIDLNGMSGLEALPKLKYLAPASKIIILTMFDQDELIFKAIQEGANAYILKSSTYNDYETIIYQVLEEGFVINPKLASKILGLFVHENKKSDYGLTKREQEILKLFVDVNDKQKISELLFISPFTVDTHIKNIYSKLQVHSQLELSKKAFKENLI